MKLSTDDLVYALFQSIRTYFGVVVVTLNIKIN